MGPADLLPQLSLTFVVSFLPGDLCPEPPARVDQGAGSEWQGNEMRAMTSTPDRELWREPSTRRGRPLCGMGPAAGRDGASQRWSILRGDLRRDVEAG